MLRLFKLAFAGIFTATALTVSVAPHRAPAAEPAATSQQALDRAAIENLIVKYGIALDTLDADTYASVFTPDAEFTFGGNTYHGRAEIRKIVTGLEQRRASQPPANPPVKQYHAITNTMIEFVNDHEAHHRSYWQTIRGPSAGPFTVGGMGTYVDTIVKRNGEWLIAKREIVQ